MKRIEQIPGRKRKQQVIYNVIDVISGKPNPTYDILAYPKVMDDAAHCGQQKFARRVIHLKPKY